MKATVTSSYATRTVLVLAMTSLAACATVEDLVVAPAVSLRNVHVQDIDLSGQTFVLSFDVTNPNAFALPINTINYGVELDGHRFASGEAQSAFTVPARGDGEFAISVDLNLLRTAPELLFIVRDGVRGDIPYRIEGQFGVDLPFAKPIHFSNNGKIQLQSSVF